METAELNRLLDMEKNSLRPCGTRRCRRRDFAGAATSRADLKDPSRPIGSFIFLGADGCGQDASAKALAEFMFETPGALIQLTCRNTGEV